MVFMLSVVIGFYVIGNVHHALHTPLMSVTNAISGIIVVGALLQVGHDSVAVSVLAFVGILVASINVFGGFRVTARMLEMFKREEAGPMTLPLSLVQGAYIVAGLLFILALAGLSQHETARDRQPLRHHRHGRRPASPRSSPRPAAWTSPTSGRSARPARAPAGSAWR